MNEAVLYKVWCFVRKWQWIVYIPMFLVVAAIVSIPTIGIFVAGMAAALAIFFAPIHLDTDIVEREFSIRMFSISSGLIVTSYIGSLCCMFLLNRWSDELWTVLYVHTTALFINLTCLVFHIERWGRHRFNRE